MPNRELSRIDYGLDCPVYVTHALSFSSVVDVVAGLAFEFLVYPPQTSFEKHQCCLIRTLAPWSTWSRHKPSTARRNACRSEVRVNMGNAILVIVHTSVQRERRRSLIFCSAVLSMDPSPRLVQDQRRNQRHSELRPLRCFRRSRRPLQWQPCWRRRSRRAKMWNSSHHCRSTQCAGL